MHWLSTPERFLLHLGENLAADREIVDLATRDAVAALLVRMLPALNQAYRPPRFVHGDCHANTFFLSGKGAHMQVAGIVDLETCAAGCPLFDLAKFLIEMAGYLGGTSPWWEPLFAGYEEEPDFDVMRMILLGHAHRLYTLGAYRWPGSRQDILGHLLTARDWPALLDPTHICESPTKPPASRNEH